MIQIKVKKWIYAWMISSAISWVWILSQISFEIHLQRFRDDPWSFTLAGSFLCSLFWGVPVLMYKFSVKKGELRVKDRLLVIKRFLPTTSQTYELAQLKSWSYLYGKSSHLCLEFNDGKKLYLNYSINTNLKEVRTYLEREFKLIDTNYDPSLE